MTSIDWTCCLVFSVTYEGDYCIFSDSSSCYIYIYMHLNTLGGVYLTFYTYSMWAHRHPGLSRIHMIDIQQRNISLWLRKHRYMSSFGLQCFSVAPLRNPVTCLCIIDYLIFSQFSYYQYTVHYLGLSYFTAGTDIAGQRLTHVSSGTHKASCQMFCLKHCQWRRTVTAVFCIHINLTRALNRLL